MKPSKHIVLFISFLFCNVLIYSEAYARELKIGYVNTIKVIEEAPQASSALKKLETEFGPRDKKLVDLQNQIKTIEADLTSVNTTISSSQRKKKESQIVSLKREFRRSTQEFREDYNLRRNEELSSLQKLVYNVIVEIAKEEQYDLILHEGTIYAGQKVDITAKVLRKLKQKVRQ